MKNDGGLNCVYTRIEEESKDWELNQKDGIGVVLGSKAEEIREQLLSDEKRNERLKKHHLENIKRCKEELSRIGGFDYYEAEEELSKLEKEILEAKIKIGRWSYKTIGIGSWNELQSKKKDIRMAVKAIEALNKIGIPCNKQVERVSEIGMEVDRKIKIVNDITLTKRKLLNNKKLVKDLKDRLYDYTKWGLTREELEKVRSIINSMRDSYERI